MWSWEWIIALEKWGLDVIEQKILDLGNNNMINTQFISFDSFAIMIGKYLYLK